MDKQKLSVIDLFCGAGGFSTGFLMTGAYEILAGLDFVISMEKSFTTNHKGAEFINYDIRKGVPQNVLELNPDIVIGSPPCQGFSDARGIRYRLDEKNDLVFHYYNWINQIRPKIAIMENVKGMSTIGKAWKSLDNPDREEDIDFMELLRQKAKDIGYTFKYDILNSKFYGTPQERERVFCLMTREDLNINLKFPKKTHFIPNEGRQKRLDSFMSKNGKNNEQLINLTTIKEAIADLPEPEKYENNNHIDVVAEFDYKATDKKTWFQELIFDSNKITNHVARYPRDQEELEIINRIPEGLTYRSDRKGAKHISVWDLFKDQLSNAERELLREMNVLRVRKDVKTKKGKHSEGYVPLKYLSHYPEEVIYGLVEKKLLKKPTLCLLSDESKEILDTTLISGLPDQKVKNGLISKRDFIILEKLNNLIKENASNKGIPDYLLGIQPNTLKRLVKKNWIITFPGENEFDYTSKAGHRGRFSRLKMDSQSRTLMTGFTSPREILHPTKNRGLSLREGARLMSFPDSFSFYGSFSQISLQIGNAVAPLVARQIAINILKSFRL